MDVIDGRHLRRDQNRDAVVDALVALFEEGNLQPSSAEIAERAGLSSRSLFRYFDDIDDLNRAAIDRQLTLARPLLDPDVSADDPLAVRIERLVETRARMFGTIAPAARAARVSAHRRPVVGSQLTQGRAYLRAQVLELFGPAHLPAIDVLCSFESYELLRFDQKLSRAKTVSALTAALTALLGGDQ
jgi:AcrR family transcriptional regulator